MGSSKRLIQKVFLDSQQATENSVVGLNMTNTLPGGGVYVTGFYKNSNAIRIPSALAPGAELSLSNLVLSKEGAVSIRFKPIDWNLVNTTLSSGVARSIFFRNDTLCKKYKFTFNSFFLVIT